MDGKLDFAANLLWRARHDGLEARPIVIPVKTFARVVSDRPYDGMAVLEVICSRDAR